MRRLNDVDHLVHDEVLQTFYWLLGQLGIQSDGLLAGVAASPAGFHLLDE